MENNTLVLDLKGVFSIGTAVDEPIRSFMMLLLPTAGKSVRVPHCPANFIVSSPSWSTVTFPCWVMFNDQSKRKYELAVAVLDYSRVNPTMDLISVESLAQPIRIRNNVCKSDQDCRITSITNVKGFRGIDKTVDEVGVIGLWSVGAVWADVWDYCDTPVRSRLPQLIALARSAASNKADEAGVQDSHMLDVTMALKSAHVNKLGERLASINLELYDKSVEERVATFDAENTEQLRTHERVSISAGTARIVTTRFVNHVIIALDDEAEAAAAAAAAACAPGGSGGGGGSDDLRDVEEVDAEVEAAAAAVATRSC
eukprot:6191773-Pleurochrysis_carterae.AAC.1